MRKSIIGSIVPSKLIVLVFILAVFSMVFPAKIAAAPLYKISCAFNYRIRSDDTLAKIASRYSVKPVDIVRVNKLHKPYTIYVGQTICIPNLSKSGFTDIPKVNANAKAGYFVASWDEKGVRVTGTNFGKNGNYYVKVDDPTDNVKKMLKIGLFRSGKKGNNTSVYKLPKNLTGADSLKVCLKNARNDMLLCNVIYKWSRQSYFSIQQVR